MRKVFAMLAVAGLMAAPAMADLSGWTGPGNPDMPIFTAQAVAPVAGDVQPLTRANSLTYDGLGPGVFGFAAFPGASGVIGYDDFVTNSGVALMSDFYFVGGVAVTGQMINFYFFSAGNLTTPVNSFGLTFPAGGNFIWTVGGFPTSASTSPFVIPHTGYLVGVAPAGSLGRWFLTSHDAVVVGSNAQFVGGASSTSAGATISLVHAFALGGIPEPATLALLAAAGAVFFVRRRK